MERRAFIALQWTAHGTNEVVQCWGCGDLPWPCDRDEIQALADAIAREKARRCGRSPHGLSVVVTSLTWIGPVIDT